MCSPLFVFITFKTSLPQTQYIYVSILLSLYYNVMAFTGSGINADNNTNIIMSLYVS